MRRASQSAMSGLDDQKLQYKNKGKNVKLKSENYVKVLWLRDLKIEKGEAGNNGRK